MFRFFWSLTMNKNVNRTRLINECDKIVKRGTGIRSFVYDGKTRNVVIGPHSCRNNRWGKVVVDRAVVEKRGKFYLIAQDHNDGDQIKTFSVDKIKDFHFVLA